jgi:hypothetical protein
MMPTVEELNERAELYDYERLTPFSMPESMEVFSDTPLPLESFVETLLRRKQLKKSELNRIDLSQCEERTLRQVVSVPPADNMGGVKYQRIYGGYDGGVEAGFEGTWGKSQFERVKELLSLAKQAADDGDDEKSYVEFGGRLWKVSAKGASSGGSAPKYKFVLEHHGIKLYIHSNPKGGIQPVRVRFGFHALAKASLWECVETLRDTLSKEGFRITEEKLTRVDMQVLLERSLQDFVKAMQGDTVVTLCRGKFTQISNLRTGEVETILLKSETTELEIYDKRTQILAADKETYELFRRFVLGSGPLPEYLTRVEFRFHRESLKRYGINSFDDLKESALALIQIATSEWFRILETSKVRGSENTQKISPLWQEVVDAFEYYFSESNEIEVERTRQDLQSYVPDKDGTKIDRLVKQAVGCLASVGAFCLDKIEDGEQLLDYGVTRLREYLVDMVIKYKEKRVFNEVVKGFVPGDLSCEETLDPRFACATDLESVISSFNAKLLATADVPF